MLYSSLADMLTISIISVLLLALMVYNMVGWPRISPSDGSEAVDVSLLIPARNEEPNIARALEGALAQSAAPREVLVYDDHSTDRTADIVEAFAARSDRVRRVAPQPLPDGWCGKPFACARLAAEARASGCCFWTPTRPCSPGPCPESCRRPPVAS